MTVGGKLEPWPAKVWTDCPGVCFAAETNKNQFRLEVAADAPAGAHLIRFYNEDGASSPRIFVLSSGRQINEAEPNNDIAEARPVGELPLTVNGRFDRPGDVDSFTVSLAAGEWLDARLDAYTLASKVDPLLRLVSLEGVQLAWNHDFATLDPRLIWQAPADTECIVQVMGFKYPATAEVSFAGGDGCVYRLHLSRCAGRPDLFAGGDPEDEPNNGATNATALILPAVVRGAIDPANDRDCFAFSARKDEQIEALVEAASLGSKLDAWLSLTDDRGKELARSDDLQPLRNPRLDWKAPGNGTYHLVVGNVMHAGGPEYGYHLRVRRVPPGYHALTAVNSLTLAPGETNELKIAVARLGGFDHALTVALQGVPPGVHAPEVTIAANSGEGTLRIVADPEAPLSQGPMQVVVRDALSGEEHAALCKLTSASEDNGVPGGYAALLVEATDQIWLTVKATAAAK